MVLAAAGGVIAAVFLFRADYDKAFVAAAAGAVCWFLNYRQQLKAKLNSRNESIEEEDDEADEEVRS